MVSRGMEKKFNDFCAMVKLTVRAQMIGKQGNSAESNGEP
jgi:hypothetical protein